MKAQYYMNELSLKDIKTINDGSVREYIIGKFIFDMNKRTGKRLDLRLIYRAMFGNKWYEQPYSKLYRAANMATNCDDYMSSSYMATVRRNRQTIVPVETIEQSIMAKQFSKIYGKKRMQEQMYKLIEQGLMENKIRDYMWRAVKAYRIAKQYMYIEKSDLVKISERADHIARENNYLANRICGKAIELYGSTLFDELIWETTGANVRQILNKETCMDEIKTRIINNIINHANRTTYGYSEEVTSKELDKMAESVSDYYKLRDFERILDEIDMKPSEAHWNYPRGAKKLSDKYFKAIKQVVESQESIETQRDLLETLTASLSDNLTRRGKWAPVLVKK